MALRFTLRQLEYLVAVGDCSSVTIAAERQNVSAPSISIAIAQLEAEMGLPLFIRRHAQGMTPTPQGMILIGHARRILDQARQMIEAANRLTDTVAGVLNVGCLATFAQVLLPRLRRSFASRYPEVEFHQFESHQLTIIEALRGARMDVALTYDLAIPTDLTFVGLVELSPFAMFAETHELAQRASVSPADLADEPMILLDLPHSADYLLSFFERAGKKPRIFERTRDMALVQSMVANGFGYAIANFRPWSDEAPDGRRLRFVPLTGGVKAMRMGLLHAAGADNLPTIRAFIDMCRETLPGYVEGSLTVRSSRPAVDF